MQQRHSAAIQKVFISTAVIVVSVSATFILFYYLTPRIQDKRDAINVVSVPSGSYEVVRSEDVASPVVLKIDSIGVATDISPVGLNDAGDMAIDDDPKQAAWYKLGPKPGEEGSAVIAGHYGWKNGSPSVFNDLNKLVKGDTISTLDENGRLMNFVVTRTALYAPDQDATDVFRSDDGKAHLNLVTCQGSWNNTAKTYSERLIIFTDYVQ